MSESDPFRGAFERPEELREFYNSPMEAAIRKDIGHIDELCRRLIAASPMLFVATFSPEGQADVSPRGGQPGFVTVLDDRHLAIPDATGNRRLDSLENVSSSGRIGLIFLIPGRDTTLRVNGRAAVSGEPELLDRLTPVGKPSKTASSWRPRRSTRTARRRSCARSCGTRRAGRTPRRPHLGRGELSRTSATRSSRSSRSRSASARRWRSGSPASERPADQPVHHTGRQQLRHHGALLCVVSDEIAGVRPARVSALPITSATSLGSMPVSRAILCVPSRTPASAGRTAAPPRGNVLEHLVSEALSLVPDRGLDATRLDQDHVHCRASAAPGAASR